MFAQPIIDQVRTIVCEPAAADRVLAYMHLHAVLPRLEELVRLDDEARGLAADLKVSIAFAVLHGPRVTIRFDRGVVTSSRTGGSDVVLLFPSCSHLNRMFAGEKVTPLPVKGLQHFKALQKFTRLTEILTRYLKPTEADLASAAFRKKYVEMSLMVGLAACGPIARYDPKAKRVADALHDATIQYSVNPDGPHAYVRIAHGDIEAVNGKVADPTTTIELRDVDLAVGVIQGKVDTFAANGGGAIRASGDLHTADEFNHLFDRVGMFLK